MTASIISNTSPAENALQEKEKTGLLYLTFEMLKNEIISMKESEFIIRIPIGGDADGR